MLSHVMEAGGKDATASPTMIQRGYWHRHGRAAGRHAGRQPLSSVDGKPTRKATKHASILLRCSRRRVLSGPEPPPHAARLTGHPPRLASSACTGWSVGGCAFRRLQSAKVGCETCVCSGRDAWFCFLVVGSHPHSSSPPLTTHQPVEPHRKRRCAMCEGTDFVRSPAGTRVWHECSPALRGGRKNP